MIHELSIRTPGWMSLRDLELLGKIAGLVPENGNIVEVGTFLGKSTSALFLNKKSNVKLSIVDLFNLSDSHPIDIDWGSSLLEGNKNLFEEAVEISKNANSWQAGFRFCLGEDIVDQITIHKIDSVNYKPESFVDLVFIDGDHRFEGVLLDLLNFDNPETLIIADNANGFNPGVIKAIFEFNKNRNRTLLFPSNSKMCLLIPQTGFWVDHINQFL